MVSSNGGFPPPAAQSHRVNHPDKERHPGLRGRLGRAGIGGLTASTEQLIHQTVFLSVFVVALLSVGKNISKPRWMLFIIIIITTKSI